MLNKCLIISLCLVSLVGCNSLSQIPVTGVYQSQHCQVQQPQLRVLSVEGLSQFLAKARQFTLKNDATTSDLAKTMLDLEKKEMAVLIAWGSQSNSGYRLSLTGKSAQLKEGRLELPVEFVEPRPGMLTAQIMTTPCIVLKMNRHTEIHRLVAGPLSHEIK